MAKITFEIPDDFVPLKGVAMLSGWKEGNPPVQYLFTTHLPDTANWERAALYREGLRVTDANMARIWGGLSRG